MAGHQTENAQVWRPLPLGRIEMLQWKARFWTLFVVLVGIAAVMGKGGKGAPDWLNLNW